MASKQSRVEKTSAERKPRVNGDNVSKVTSQFESRAKESEDQQHGGLDAVKDYALNVASHAKDVTVETASNVKDRAVVAGWTAAHFTTEKTVEAASAVEGAAEYVGHRAAELVAKPLGAVKETAKSTGESMMEYTARKKEEANRGIEIEESEGQEKPWSEDTAEENHGEWMSSEYGEGQQGRSGILQAIGETILEILQTTKHLVIGKNPYGRSTVDQYQSKQERSISETAAE